MFREQTIQATTSDIIVEILLMPWKQPHSREWNRKAKKQPKTEKKIFSVKWLLYVSVSQYMMPWNIIYSVICFNYIRWQWESQSNGRNKSERLLFWDRGEQGKEKLAAVSEMAKVKMWRRKATIPCLISFMFKCYLASLWD